MDATNPPPQAARSAAAEEAEVWDGEQPAIPTA
jgi:hypothetical protein